MNSHNLFSQLKVMSGGSLDMSTEQLAQSLSINPKAINWIKFFYPIVAVANCLLSDEPELQVQVAVQQKIEPAFALPAKSGPRRNIKELKA